MFSGGIVNVVPLQSMAKVAKRAEKTIKLALGGFHLVFNTTEQVFFPFVFTGVPDDPHIDGGTQV